MTCTFSNQSNLRIRLYLGIDLSDAASVLIKATNPNDVAFSWTATIQDTTEGIIYVDLGVGETLGTAGVWTFWSLVTFSDGRVAPSCPTEKTIKEEGQT